MTPHQHPQTCSVLCCCKSRSPGAWVTSGFQTPLSGCKQCNVNNCKSWRWNPWIQDPNLFLQLKYFLNKDGFAGVTGANQWPKGSAAIGATKSSSRSFYLPFHPLSSMLPKLLVSGFYGNTTSLFVPTCSYWKTYNNLPNTRKNPTNSPEMLRSATTFLYQTDSGIETVSMCSLTMCQCYIFQKLNQIKPQPETLERNNSWMLFVSALTTCTAQAPGSAPQFNISCARELENSTCSSSSRHTCTRKKVF